MKKLPRPNIFICLFWRRGRVYSADEEMRDGAWENLEKRFDKNSSV